MRRPSMPSHSAGRCLVRWRGAGAVVSLSPERGDRPVRRTRAGCVPWSSPLETGGGEEARAISLPPSTGFQAVLCSFRVQRCSIALLVTFTLPLDECCPRPAVPGRLRPFALRAVVRSPECHGCGSRRDRAVSPGSRQPLELKIDFGPGYRVYFGKDAEAVVVLLGGSAKKHQAQAISAAQAAWVDYKQRKRRKGTARRMGSHSATSRQPCWRARSATRSSREGAIHRGAERLSRRRRRYRQGDAARSHQRRRSASKAWRRRSEASRSKSLDRMLAPHGQPEHGQLLRSS